MNKTFCVNCGHKNIYEIEKPKFCASCGGKVNEVSSASSKEDEETTPNLQVEGLEIEIEGEGRINLMDVVQEKRSSYPTRTPTPNR